MTRSSTAQQRLRQLLWEAADDPHAALHLAQRALEQIRRTQPPAQVERVAQVDAEGGQVLRQAGGGAWVLALQLADQAPQTCFRLLRRGGAVERGPVGGLDPSADVFSFRQLGQDVAQAVDAAALAGRPPPQPPPQPCPPPA